MYKQKDSLGRDLMAEETVYDITTFRSSNKISSSLESTNERSSGTRPSKEKVYSFTEHQSMPNTERTGIILLNIILTGF